jgi:hypothetical protein
VTALEGAKVISPGVDLNQSANSRSPVRKEDRVFVVLRAVHVADLIENEQFALCQRSPWRLICR